MLGKKAARRTDVGIGGLQRMLGRQHVRATQQHCEGRPQGGRQHAGGVRQAAGQQRRIDIAPTSRRRH
jgi:hypothetical protein